MCAQQPPKLQWATATAVRPGAVYKAWGWGRPRRKGPGGRARGSGGKGGRDILPSIYTGTISNFIKYYVT